MTRRWRWVTRDLNTEYEDTVNIWPGSRRPTSRNRWVGPTDDGVCDYHQGQGEAIDIFAPEFERVYSLVIECGSCQKIEFSASIK